MRIRSSCFLRPVILRAKSPSDSSSDQCLAKWASFPIDPPRSTSPAVPMNWKLILLIVAVRLLGEGQRRLLHKTLEQNELCSETERKARWQGRRSRVPGIPVMAGLGGPEARAPHEVWSGTAGTTRRMVRGGRVVEDHPQAGTRPRGRRQRVFGHRRANGGRTAVEVSFCHSV